METSGWMWALTSSPMTLSCTPAPQAIEGHHGALQVGRGGAQNRAFDHRASRTCTHATFSARTRTAPAPSPATRLPRCCPVAASTTSVPGTERQNERHGRVRDRPLVNRGHSTVTEPSHADTSHPAGPRRACDIPHRRIVTFVHGGPHHPRPGEPADRNICPSQRHARAATMGS